MATDDYDLVPPPDDPGGYGLWLQNAAGFILFEEVRRAACKGIDPSLPADVRAHVEAGIDSAMFYLLRTVKDHGSLWNGSEGVELVMVARHVRAVPGSEEDEVLAFSDVAEPEEVLWLVHDWREGDFGEAAVARRKPEGWREAHRAEELARAKKPCPPDEGPGCDPSKSS